MNERFFRQIFIEKSPLIIQRAFAFRFVIPWGLEPQSKEPESFILSIELRNRLSATKVAKLKEKRRILSSFFILIDFLSTTVVDFQGVCFSQFLFDVGNNTHRHIFLYFQVVDNAVSVFLIAGCLLCSDKSGNLL